MNKRIKGGFTLVEIMIVVAIIALLAALAIPGFLRARQRGQASNVLNDARILDAAVDQWAIEQNKGKNDTPTFPDLTPYLKANSRLVSNGGNDLFGNAYKMPANVGSSIGVTIATATKAEFDPTVVPSEFWAGY